MSNMDADSCRTDGDASGRRAKRERWRAEESYALQTALASAAHGERTTADREMVLSKSLQCPRGVEPSRTDVLSWCSQTNA